MDIDACFCARLVDGNSLAPLSMVKPNYLADDWNPRLAWVIQFTKTHGVIPKRETFEVHFKIKLPKAPEPASFYAAALRKRAMGLSLKAGLLKPLTALEQQAPEKCLSELKNLLAETARNFHVTGEGGAMIEQKSIGLRKEFYLERKAKKGLLGIPCPWKTINESTLGACPGDVWMLLAKSNMGKTWLALLMANYAARMCGKRVLIASQEMTPKRLSVRVDALGAKISALRFRSGQLTTEEEAQYFAFLEKCKNPDAQKWGAISIVGQRDIQSVLDLEIALDTYTPEVVIWDSYYLIASKDWKDQSKIVSDIKSLAERRGVPIICTTQFNRTVTAADTKADQNAAGWASAVVQDVDCVIGMFQPPELKLEKTMKLSSIKVRDGIAFDDISIWWDLETMNFSEKDVASMEAYGDDPVPTTFFNKGAVEQSMDGEAG